MKSRIVITVRGGVAEIEDAENWPKGLELYVVDYDNNEDGGAVVNGHRCSIAKHDGTGLYIDGRFAGDVAQAWEIAP